MSNTKDFIAVRIPFPPTENYLKSTSALPKQQRQQQQQQQRELNGPRPIP